MIKLTIFIGVLLNCLYESQFFSLPKCINEREIVKWAIVEGSDAWIYLNIKVK